MQFRSNLFYQKFLKKASAPPPKAAGRKNPSVRGQKISSPETPPFFARSPKYRVGFTKLIKSDKVLNL